MEDLNKLIEEDLNKVKRAKFRRKSYNCRAKGIGWSLKYTDISWPERCPILGIVLDYFAETRLDSSPAYLVVKDSLGYVPGNVIVVSYRAKRLKSDGTSTEHRIIADYLDKL